MCCMYSINLDGIGIDYNHIVQYSNKNSLLDHQCAQQPCLLTNKRSVGDELLNLNGVAHRRSTLLWDASDIIIICVDGKYIVLTLNPSVKAGGANLTSYDRALCSRGVGGSWNWGRLHCKGHCGKTVQFGLLGKMADSTNWMMLWQCWTKWTTYEHCRPTGWLNGH